MSETVRLLLFVGFFGAFTTMSSVSLEMSQFSSNDMLRMVFIVFAMNAVVCIFAGFLSRGLTAIT